MLLIDLDFRVAMFPGFLWQYKKDLITLVCVGVLTTVDIIRPPGVSRVDTPVDGN